MSRDPTAGYVGGWQSARIIFATAAGLRGEVPVVSAGDRCVASALARAPSRWIVHRSNKVRRNQCPAHRRRPCPRLQPRKFVPINILGGLRLFETISRLGCRDIDDVT